MSFHRPLVLSLVLATASLSGVAAASPRHAGERDQQSQVGDRRVVVRSHPPETRVERVTHRPTERHVWRGGHWRWQNHWVWSSGGWVIPPHPAAFWVAGHWDETPEGWVWEPGHWA